MYKPHTTCRACGYARTKTAPGIKAQGSAEKLTHVFDLGIQPLANDFRLPGEECSGFAPLEVLFCPCCTLGQLSVVVRPDILYRHYSYVTSASETMREHFQTLLKDISSATGGKRLLEIGSNDGALLEFFKLNGYDALGIDPAQNLCALAKARGVETVCALWGEQVAIDAGRAFQPDIILARHVFCHVDDWTGFIAALDRVAERDTIICIEVPHAQKLLDNCEFDTIYHEHLSYLTLRSVQALLANSPFHLISVRRYPIHGGALLLTLARKEWNPVPDKIKEECDAERCGLAQWLEFASKARELCDSLALKVGTFRDDYSSVAALGASAKSTVWVNACKFRRSDISFIADSTPLKWYTTSPGSDIPVTDEGAILRELPDYVVMFCWNFQDEVLRRNELYRQKGGKFIVPVPSVQVI